MIRWLNLTRNVGSLLPGMVLYGCSTVIFAQVTVLETETVSANAVVNTAGNSAFYSSAPSISTPPLAIEQAIAQSVQWHPAIGEAVAILSQREEQIAIARAGYYPRIQGGLRSGYDNTYDESKSSQALVLSVSQMLYDFGKVSNDVKAARAGVALGQANLLYTIDQIIRDTAYAVIEIQRYQNLFNIAEDQIEGVTRILNLAEQRSRSGASTRSDAVQAQSRLEGARVTLLQHIARLQRWQAHLASLIGESGSRTATDDFPAQLLSSCDQSESDPLKVPEFLIAQARQAEAIARRDLARSENRPTISIDPSVTHYLDNNYQVGPNQDRTQWGVFLNVNMPFYQGGSNRARVRSADFALRSAEAALESAKLIVKQGLFEAFTQTASLERSLESLARRDVSISETRDLYRQQYLDLGTRSLLDLLNAEQEIHQSRFDRQNTISDLRRLQIDCLYNTGELRDAFALTQAPVQGVEITP